MQLRDLLFKQLFDCLGSELVVVNNDYSSPFLDEIKVSRPTSVLNVGIAEQSMVSVAAGLRAGGVFSICYSISTFLFSRANEQIKIDFIAQDLPFFFVSMGPGFDYPEDGPSHHSIEELSNTFTYPHTNILNPITKNCLTRFFPPLSRLTTERYIYSLLRKTPPSQSVEILTSFFQPTDYGYLFSSGSASTLIICHGYTAHQALLHFQRLNRSPVDIAISVDLKAVIKAVNPYTRFIIWSESLIGSGFHAYHADLLRSHYRLVDILHLGVIPDHLTPFYGARHMHESKYSYGINDVLEAINQ